MSWRVQCHSLSYFQVRYSRSTHCVGCVHLPLIVEPWLLLAHPRSATACVLFRVTQHKIQVIHKWLLLGLNLEVPRRGQPVNQVRFLLVPGLGQLREKYRACWSQALLVWENLGKSEAWVKTSHSYGKATGNILGGPKSWAGPQGITRVGQTVWSWLMEI